MIRNYIVHKRLCLECGYDWSTIGSSLVSAVAMSTIMTCVEPTDEAQESVQLLRDSTQSIEDVTTHLRRLSTGSIDNTDMFSLDSMAKKGATQQKHIPGISNPLNNGSNSLPRQMSVKSKTTLSTLQTLEERIETLSVKVKEVEDEFSALSEDNESDTTPTPSPELNRLKSIVAQLNGDIERLQFEGIDAVLITELQSGKETAKTQRKLLTYRIEDLVSRLEKIKQIC